MKNMNRQVRNMKFCIGQALLALLLAASSGVMAYDFSAVSPSGHMLYYNRMAAWAEVVFPGDARYPGSGWGGYTRPTGTLVIPDSVSFNGVSYPVRFIGKYAFFECSGIDSLIVSEGVRSIRANAFKGCTSLRYASMPATMDTLGTYAFSGCTSLEHFVVRRATSPYMMVSVFSNCNLSRVTLHVPCGAADAYTDPYSWASFGLVQEANCDSIAIVGRPNHAERGSVTGGGTYAEGERVTLQAIPAAGHLFACWNDGDTLASRTLTVHEPLTLTALFFERLHDTLCLHDTVLLHDTVTLSDAPLMATLSVRSANGALGVGAGNGRFPVGSEVEIAAVAFEGARFERWDDGNTDNPRRIVLGADMAFSAGFAPLSALEAAQVPATRCHTEGRLLMVEHPEADVCVYTLQGVLLARLAPGEASCLALPAAGVYVVQARGCAATRVLAE